MRITREPRQSVLSVKVTQEMRQLVELLAGHLTLKTGHRHTMTDVVELALRGLAKREKVAV